MSVTNYQKITVILPGIIGFIVGIILAMFIVNDSANAIEPVEMVTSELSVPTPTPTPEPLPVAKITAYTCDPTMTPEQIAMNCPSLAYAPNGRTSTGTTPRHNITVACDRANIGNRFHIVGVGEVVCEDVGGAIKGEKRFDLYFDTYEEAIQWGKQYLEYEVL